MFFVADAPAASWENRMLFLRNARDFTELDQRMAHLTAVTGPVYLVGDGRGKALTVEPNPAILVSISGINQGNGAPPPPCFSICGNRPGMLRDLLRRVVF